MGLRLPPEARTAQNRRATGRLKRNRCGRSTFGTIRLSFGAYPYLGASLGLAFLAAFWGVFEMFFDEEELLSSRENELGVAINALQNPVRKFHGLLSAASEIPECRVRAKFYGARMGVGKYVSGLTASQPRLYSKGSKAATLGLFLLRRVQSTPQSSMGKRRRRRHFRDRTGSGVPESRRRTPAYPSNWNPGALPRGATILTHNAVKNHSSQTHAVCDD